MRRYLGSLALIGTLVMMGVFSMMAPVLPVAAAAPDHLTASVSDPSPAPQANETITATFTDANGQPIAGAKARLSWSFKRHKVGCSAVTDTMGVAQCTRGIGTLKVGKRVPVVVSIRYKGNTYRAKTAFTPK